MKTLPIAVIALIATGFSGRSQTISLTPLFPVPGEIFQGTGSPLLTYSGLPPVTGLSIHAGAQISPPGDLSVPPAFDSFFDVFVEIDFMGFPTGTASGQMRAVGSTIDPPLPGSRTFDTEMLQLDLIGSVPGGPSFLLRESPTLQSLGGTTITQAGTGPYHIASFFDVFTELSLDGGETWLPQQSGPAHLLNTDTDVPEASTVGAIGLLSLAVGWRFLGRRRG